MSVKFQTQIRTKDLYLFNLYHTYTSTQGLMPMFVGIFLVVWLVLKADRYSSSNLFMCVVLVIFLIFYHPLILYVRSKGRLHTSEILSQPLAYEADDKGIWVESPAAEERECLEWAQIYKVKATRSYLYIFSNNVNAYILPKEQLGERLEPLQAMCKEHLEEFRISGKSLKS